MSETESASYADLLTAPEHMVAELVNGAVHLSPRPAGPHANAATILGEELGGPFRRGKDGPGGWLFLDEPELHLGEDVVVPDLAGWRRTTMAEIPNTSWLAVRPDWACEVLSPSTARFDRVRKLPIYAHAGVGHVWLVDPLQRLVEVLRLEHGRYSILATHHGDDRVRAEPFDAIELELAVLWLDSVPE